MEVDAKTRLYMLFGNPVSHSLSPALHNAGFQALNLNCIYLACPVEPDMVGAAVSGIKALAAGGANVTSPHKEAVIKHLDEISAEAEALNSVNTIINRDGSLYGTSTDGTGFIKALQEWEPGAEKARPALIVGAGGAARAAAHALAVDGGGSIYIANRSPGKARAAAGMLRRWASIERCVAVDLEEAALERALAECRLVVYCLPHDAPELINALGGTGRSQAGKMFYDLRYSPERTAVMEAFEQAGGRAANGLAMLFWQAVYAFELFTGRQAPVEDMRRAIKNKR